MSTAGKTTIGGAIATAIGMAIGIGLTATMSEGQALNLATALAALTVAAGVLTNISGATALALKAADRWLKER